MGSIFSVLKISEKMNYLPLGCWLHVNWSYLLMHLLLLWLMVEVGHSGGWWSVWISHLHPGSHVHTHVAFLEYSSSRGKVSVIIIIIIIIDHIGQML